MKYIKVTIPSGKTGKTFVAKQVCGSPDEYRAIAHCTAEVSADELIAGLRTNDLRTKLVKSAAA